MLFLCLVATGIEKELGMDNEKVFETAKLGRLIEMGTLVGNGADLSVTDEEGKTPLIHAAEHNRYRVAGLLLGKYPDNINAKDNSGKTALMYACENACYETVALLLNQKIEVDTLITDNGGKAALDYAQANGNKKTLKVLKKALSEKLSLDELNKALEQADNS